MDIQKVFYDISVSDLKVAQTLYEKKYYSQSLFYFEQSIEKANKSWALFLGILTPEELFTKGKKRIGHESQKSYNKALEKELKNLEFFKNINNQCSSFINNEVIQKLNILEYEESIRKTIDINNNLKNYDLDKLTKNDILYMIDEIYDLNKETIKFPQELDLKFIDEIINTTFNPNHFITNKIREDIEIFQDNEIMNQEFKHQINTFLKILLDFQKIQLCFYNLAIITNPHVSSSRYPFINPELNPLIFYKKKNPIIKYQDILMKLHKNALLRYKKFKKRIEMLNSSQSNQ